MNRTTLAASLGLALTAVPVVSQVTPPPGQDLRAVAVRVSEAPDIDGVLDETFWSTIEPVTDFRQRDPIDGAPASERSEVRIAYDENALYFGLVLHDSRPELIRRSILERGGRIDKDDLVVIALDTYHDGRNGYIFEIGALGTQDDALFADERLAIDDWSWDGVYFTETRVTPDGWVLEVAIPFTTIRFEGTAPEMGILFHRSIRRKNEWVSWPHVGQEYRSAYAQVSQYATLTGLENIRRGRYIELKPYAISGGQRFDGDVETNVESDVGLDVKYSIRPNLTADFTLNTDFAQVEADNVQINLTRFSLFFPEKREFFLERAGLFQFGAPRETEVFFSRRVGLDSDVLGGGRLTGQAGPFSIGVMSLRTGESGVGDGLVPAAWNSVARIRGDGGGRTSLGAIATAQETTQGHNRVAGVDFTTRFWSSSSLLLWAANVWDAQRRDHDGSTGAAQAELMLRNDRYMFEITRTRIGQDFSPALGFVPRPDQARWGGQFGITPMFEQSGWARSAEVSFGGNHITGIEGVKQSHHRRVNSSLRLESGETVNVRFAEQFERVEAPVRISGRELPTGDYTFRSVSGSARTNDSRTLSGSVSWSVGDFWSGTRTQLAGGATWKTGPHLTLGGSINWNDVSLPVADGDFTATLLSLDIGGAVNRKLFANALVQWDDVSSTLQANIRVDWIHTPGSDLFLVIDTGYRTGDLLDPLAQRWLRRTGVVKLTYLKAL